MALHTSSGRADSFPEAIHSATLLNIMANQMGTYFTARLIGVGM